ncbi:MAG: hypothetical protein WKG00_11250 [Polyangiaceae bacterium]
MVRLALTVARRWLLAGARGVSNVQRMNRSEDERCSGTCEVGSIGGTRDASQTPRLDGSRSSWHGVAGVVGAFVVAALAPPPADRADRVTAAAALADDGSSARFERRAAGAPGELEVLTGETRVAQANGALLRVVERAELDARGLLVRARIEVHDERGPQEVRTLDVEHARASSWGAGGERAVSLDTRHPWVFLAMGPSGALLTPVSAHVIVRATDSDGLVLLIADEARVVPGDQLTVVDGDERWVFAAGGLGRFQGSGAAARLVELRSGDAQPSLTPFPPARANAAPRVAAEPAR